MKLPRLFFLSVSVIATLLLVGAFALVLCFSWWVPRYGTQWLIRRVEQSGTYALSIETMRYEPLHGFLLTNVRLTERSSNQIWLFSPTLEAHVGWVPLLLRQRVFVRVRGTMERPCRTEAMVVGRYDIGRQALTLHITTMDIPIRSIVPPFAQYVPSTLREGAIQLTLHLTRLANRPPTLNGHIVGNSLVWTSGALRATGTMIVDGTLTPPLEGQGAWSRDLRISVTNGGIVGLPAPVTSIQALEGHARLIDERLEITELSGTALGSTWRAKGSVELLTSPSIELFLTSEAQLAPLMQAVPSLKDRWALDGITDVRSVCRGPLQAPAWWDCLATVNVDHATLTGTALKAPLNDIKGRLRYDHLSQQLTVESLQANLLHGVLSTHGTIRLSSPITVAMDLHGTMPLNEALTWWPTEPPLSVENGMTTLDLHLDGRPETLIPTGHVDVEDARLTHDASHLTFEHVAGSILLHEDAIIFQQFTFATQQRPFTLTATVQPNFVCLRKVTDTPRISMSVRFPQGQLQLASRVTPDAFIVDDSRLWLDQNQLQCTGIVSRDPERSTQVNVSGTVDVAQLSHLSFLPLPWLEAWKLRGMAFVNATLRGPFIPLSEATIKGSITIPSLTIRDVPLEQLTCTIEQHDQILNLHIPSTTLAGGRGWGTLVITHRPAAHLYRFDADVVGVHLEQLAHVIPAWRSRQVTGIASGHLRLVGTWEARSTWQGSGWLNASGQRLGEIPLLDTLFQQAIFGSLANWLGLEPLRRAEVTQASLHWKVAQERVSTEDLRLEGLVGNAAAVVYVNGSVGFDRTLDLVVKPELSEQIIVQSRVVSGIANVLQSAGLVDRFSQLVRYRITGTLKEPQSHFEVTPQQLLKQLFGPLSNWLPAGSS